MSEVIENKTVEDTNKETNVEETGTVETQVTDKKDEGADIKAEAQKIADGMVAKKMKGMPTKEELDAFKKWQDEQKTVEEKQAEQVKEHVKLQSDYQTLQNEMKIIKAGVNADDSDYVLFKVSKIDGDFEENLNKFLKDNPKYVNSSELEDTQQKSTGTATKRVGSMSADPVTAKLKAKYPNLDLDTE